MEPRLRLSPRLYMLCKRRKKMVKVRVVITHVRRCRFLAFLWFIKSSPVNPTRHTTPLSHPAHAQRACPLSVYCPPYYSFCPAAFFSLMTCRLSSFQYRRCSFSGNLEMSILRYSGRVKGCVGGMEGRRGEGGVRTKGRRLCGDIDRERRMRVHLVALFFSTEGGTEMIRKGAEFLWCGRQMEDRRKSA